MSFGYGVYFTERCRNRVIRWNPDTDVTEIIAGDDPNPDENPLDPYGIAFNERWGLIVSDKLRHRLCRVLNGRLQALALRDADGHRARKPDSSAMYDPDRPFCPSSLFTEQSGTLVTAFYDDNTLYRIHLDGRLELILGTPQYQTYSHQAFRGQVIGKDAHSVSLRGPVGVVARRDGTIFFIERHARAVREYHPNRGLRSLFDPSQEANWVHQTQAPPMGRLDSYHPVSPVSLALDRDERLHLCDNLHGSVLRLSIDQGTFERVLVSTRGPSSCLDGGPLALTFGPDGTAWVADSSTQRIQAYTIDPQGKWDPAGPKLERIGSQALWFVGGGMGLAVAPW